MVRLRFRGRMNDRGNEDGSVGGAARLRCWTVGGELPLSA